MIRIFILGVTLATMISCASLEPYKHSLPAELAGEPDYRPSTKPLVGDGFVRLDLPFPCGGSTCFGWLYLPAETNPSQPAVASASQPASASASQPASASASHPASARASRPVVASDPLPVVVMANGFCGERSFVLPPYAERFAKAGIAAFAFDYRHWGDSGGLPRYTVVNEEQVQDYLSAIAFVQSRREIDPQRVAIWGTSYSGAHVLTVASRGAPIRAVVSQVPGLAQTDTDDNYPDGAKLKLVRLALEDNHRKNNNEPRIYIQAYGSVGEFALIPYAGHEKDKDRLLGKTSRWPNLVAPALLLDMDDYKPIEYAEGLEVPTLFVVAGQDELVDNEGAHKAASVMKNARVETVDVSHFDFYVGEAFERSSAMEIAFLEQHLGPRSAVRSQGAPSSEAAPRPSAQGSR